LLFLLALFHVLLVWWIKLSNKAWKHVDYIWLGAAALGLLSLAADVRVSTANNWVKLEFSRAVSFFDVTRGQLALPMSSYACLYGDDPTANRTDDVANEFIKACQWSKAVAAHLESFDTESVPEVPRDGFPTVNLSNSALLEMPKWLDQRLAQYKEDRERYLKAYNLTKKNSWESTLSYFAPFILCFALALRITKVTGELKNAT
jgi:hypothetical protein